MLTIYTFQFQCWFSLHDVKSWVQTVANNNGYVILTRRSKSTVGGEMSKVVFMCDHGGVYRGKSSSKHTGSRKIDCPFKLIAKKNIKTGVWNLKVANNTHNHAPAKNLEGHPYAMRLTEEEKEIVAEMTKDHAHPLGILAKIKRKNQANVSSLRNVYNERRKIQVSEMDGPTPMKILLNKLCTQRFAHNYEINKNTEQLEQLFFVHPTSYKLWRAFPHVLLIDSTYKTNKFRMPFLEMVGVTSTGKTFCVGFVVLMKEREEDFIWALSNLKNTLDNCLTPRVVITDRDVGLVNACKKVFPDASHQLCRYHIFTNIGKHCRKAFESLQDWQMFERMWSRVLSSSTPETFERNREWIRDVLVDSGRASKSTVYCS